MRNIAIKQAFKKEWVSMWKNEHKLKHPRAFNAWFKEDLKRLRRDCKRLRGVEKDCRGLRGTKRDRKGLRGTERD
jgi:hypothetical protein